MALSAQDKILYVANKLGLSTLGNMQASTGAVYDVDTDISGQIFTNASRHQNPGITNIVENQFEVNEALLIETIAFYDGGQGSVKDLIRTYGSNAVVVFDLVIGNKRVMKDVPVFAAGMPLTFATTGTTTSDLAGVQIHHMRTRTQVFMEGAGILIPPQVQWYVQYKVYDVITGAPLEIADTNAIGCYLFGTRVLLNFNTTI